MLEFEDLYNNSAYVNTVFSQASAISVGMLVGQTVVLKNISHIFGNLKPEFWPLPNRIYTIKSIEKQAFMITNVPITIGFNIALNFEELDLKSSMQLVDHNELGPIYHIGYNINHFQHYSDFEKVYNLNLPIGLN